MAYEGSRASLALAGDGTWYGFVQAGRLVAASPAGVWAIDRGHWFCLPGPQRCDLVAARVLLIRCPGFTGLRSLGGPIEVAGRLRYIDGCSDTLLCPPPRAGDPCLNLLHFPPGIRQTLHQHPSLRAGIVARGRGFAAGPEGTVELAPGTVFVIPAGIEHCFVTEDESMDVIAFHPDSDWGPRDECHPMLNRTWVAGRAVDNATAQHAARELVTGAER